ncbi:MAG: tyrosine--tRNA ligase [Acidimicrobiaceae bacterium]|nr:tyrosine--tRNA ligase [Acidimicrobiaceae bacterium]
MVDLLDDLKARGLVQDTTDEAELRELLAEPPVTLYLGIDPSADSLHVGHLVGVMVLRRFADAGHRPLALIGGATGMIGDPSGRSDERNLLDAAALEANAAAIERQLGRLLDFDFDCDADFDDASGARLLDFDDASGARLVNNYHWTRDVTLIDFLRDVGKHVTVNQMIAKDSVRARMQGEQGISFTEFSYMLLQAFDFWWLHDTHGCRLQVGGSDQWGNICAGIDLVRRRSAAAAHGLTWPLMTRADGAKFGKTAEGAVWLDAERTLPFELHQYFVNTADADAERLLLQLTLLPVDEVSEIMAAHASAPHERRAQRRLADEVCTLVHDDRATEQARLAAEALFGDSSPSSPLSSQQLEALRGIVPETRLEGSAVGADEPLVDVLVAAGVCTSRSDARRAIDSGGVSVNGRRIASAGERLELVDGRYALLQRGRRRRHLLEIV